MIAAANTAHRSHQALFDGMRGFLLALSVARIAARAWSSAKAPLEIVRVEIGEFGQHGPPFNNTDDQHHAGIGCRVNLKV